MWKKLTESLPFYIRFTQNIGYEIYVTDFISVWTTECANEDFYSCLKNSNPDLDIMDKNEMLDIGKGMMENPETLKLVDAKPGATFLLTMTKVMPFGKFRLKLSLAQGTVETFNRHVMRGLLQTIIDLRQSEQELSNLLNQKDREVHEYYKLGKLNCVRFNTPMYDEKKHMEKYHMFATTFGSEMPIVPVETIAQNGFHKAFKKENRGELSSSTSQIKTEESNEPSFSNLTRTPDETVLIKEEKIELGSENPIEQDIKHEYNSGTSIKQGISDQGDLGVSPRKKQRYKLNL